MADNTKLLNQLRTKLNRQQEAVKATAELIATIESLDKMGKEKAK